MPDTAEKVRRFLKKNPVLIAGTLGFDKKPQLHKAEICYEEDGCFYFAAAKCESYYGEISINPSLVLSGYDAEEGVLLRLKGQVIFSEEESIISRCLAGSPALRKAWGKDPGMLTAYYLKDLAAELIYDDGRREEAVLGLPENILTGISVKKDKEIKERLARLIERREHERGELKEGEALIRQKIYDGTLLYLAEKAKEVWPRLNILPAEQSAVFETYDEREIYTGQARKRLGNARIEKPEDLTYWLSDESL